MKTVADKPAGRCCRDYQKSKWARCDSCAQMKQIMPSLGLCKDCTVGSAEDPPGLEVWKLHSVDCYKLRNRQQITRSN